MADAVIVTTFGAVEVGVEEVDDVEVEVEDELVEGLVLVIVAAASKAVGTQVESPIVSVLDTTQKSERPQPTCVYSAASFVDVKKRPVTQVTELYDQYSSTSSSLQ